MKKCGKCHQILPLSEFWFRVKDGCYQSYCKKCNTLYSKKHPRKYHKKLSRKEKESAFILGGYKIYILNHYSEEEYKYNILSTTGKLFKTNSDKEFIDKIKEIVYVNSR